ncbi:MAG: endonuclease III domain-containing protein [Clostridia bacterium]|nr:endonuclease III domain-containing protein [Clostridia bacterium]
MQFSSKILLNIYQCLYNKYGSQKWWPAQTKFEVVLGAILTQNTSWSNVEKALYNLKPYMTPQAIYHMDENKLAELIRPSGYYNVKAKRIKNFVNWFNKKGFSFSTLEKQSVETTRNQLLDINGIGKETADSILLYALDKPVFVIDAYTRRLFKRLGFSVPKKYDDFQKFFHENLARDTKLYNEYHALIVKHSKEHCTKNKNCQDCVLNK